MSPIARLASPARGLDTRSLIPVAAALVGALVGILLATSIPLGVGLVAIAGFALVVGFSLPVALSLAVGVLFLRHLSAVSVGPTAMAFLLLFGWSATLRSGREQLARLVRQHRSLWNVALGLLLWVSLSVLWASHPANALSKAWGWYLTAVVVVIVATTVKTPEHVAMVAAGFVAGAVASVAIGLLGGGLTSSADAIDRATASEGRLQGG